MMNPARPLHYLRAWRTFRQMTQEQLADAVGTKKNVISELESSRLRLSDKWLARIAPVLRTSPGHILDYDPHDLPTDILDIWDEIPLESRETARRVLSQFRRASR